MKPLAATDPASIGPYRLLGVLGRGGMGRVYLGESLTGRRVAIKVIRADLAEDPEFRRRFEREVTAARTVSPLYTAAVVDADTAATAPWFATAYIDGPSLSARVASDGPLGPGATLTLAAGVAEALASMHEAGLVHRDITPGNIILNASGPHIIDFGIALTPHTTKLTAGQTIGTPSYIAPEVIQGGPAGPPSDVFSLGATLVFAATGRHLITDGPLAAQILQITRGEFDLEAVPKQLRPLIVWCTSIRPEQRPTAAEVARILVGAGVAKPAPRWYASTDPAPTVTLPVARRLTRRHVLLGAGVAGLAAVGVGAAAFAGAFGGNRGATSAATTSAPPSRSPSPASAQPTPLAGDRPGAVIWEARSGVTPLGQSPAALQSPIRVMVDLDGQQLIGASGSRVFAVGLDGVERWSHTLPTGLVNLWPWGDAVLVSDYRRLWKFDARTGREEFVVDAADQEEVDSRGDNPDGHPIQIGGVALSDELAFVGLGTATIALDRSGARRWRRSRPDARNGVRPPAGVPLAHGGGWLVTHDPAGSLVDLGLRDADDGALRWLVQYEPAEASQLPPPPPNPRLGPKVDEAWHRSEGRVGTDLILIREVQEVRVVTLAKGGELWHQTSQTPIASIELMGDQVLVGADRLRAYALRTGATLWEADLRGARIAALPDGKAIFVASEQGLSALDGNGQVMWQADYPRSVSNAVPERVTVSGDLGLVTFRPRDERLEPLDVDVVAIALRKP